MPIMLNTILTEAGIPLAGVRLIRHKDNNSEKGRTPYELWRDNLPDFERYQATQGIGNRPKLNAPYWAVFVVNFKNEAVFAGLYSVKYRGLNEEDSRMPNRDQVDPAGSCDVYDTHLQDALSDLIGKLVIDWGAGALAWVQYADRNNKPIIELRKAFHE